MAKLYGQTNTNQSLTGNVTAKNPLSGNVLAKGNPGKDGVTPHIGENGNWFIGETDTGIKAQGADGMPGKNGKSAYEYAKDGGYTGTEEEFTAKLAKENFASNKADEIVETVTGTNMIVTDSANEPLRGLKIFGKSYQNEIKGNQLLPYPYTDTTKTTNGLTYVDEGDGWISVSGTSTDKTNFKIMTNEILDVNNSDEVTVSIETVGSLQDLTVGGWESNWGTFFESKTLSLSRNTTTQTGKISSNVVQIQIYTNEIGVIYNGKIRVMINKGSTPLPYEPYTNNEISPSPNYPQEITSVGDNGGVEFGVYGKNLLDVNPISTEAAGYTKEVLLPSGVYYLKYHGSDGSQNLINKKMLALINDEWVVLEMLQQLPRYYDNGNIYLEGQDMGWKGVEQKITFKKSYYVKVQNYHTKLLTLSVGDYLPNFVPYVEKQSLIIPTPNGLHGIKVTDATLANYTDSGGQMYCCDEIDLERGKHIQRIAKRTLDGSEVVGWYSGPSWPWHMSKKALFGSTIDLIGPQVQGIGTYAMSDRFTIQNTDYRCYGDINQKQMYYSVDGTTFSVNADYLFETQDDNGFKKFFSENPTTIYAILATPIETDLTEEQIAQYKALTTNYPNTTFISDAFTSVDYVADTKKYIDKKFAELATALVAMGD